MPWPFAAQLFPGDLVCVEVSPLPEEWTLHPLEAAVLARANVTRGREFAAGRTLARRALRELGFPDAPLLAGPDRAPAWPAGAVGSISHTADYCVVVVARNPPYRSLGVDAEPDTPLEAELWPQICTPTELEWLAAQPAARRGLLCHVLFAIKESVYKYQAPISGTMLEFRDVEVEFDGAAPGFRAVILRPGVPGFPAGTVVLGRTRIADGLILAGVH